MTIHRNCMGIWNHSPWKWGTCVPNIVNITAADAIVPVVAKMLPIMICLWMQNMWFLRSRWHIACTNELILVYLLEGNSGRKASIKLIMLTDVAIVLLQHDICHCKWWVAPACWILGVNINIYLAFYNSDVTMSATASQITGVLTVCSTVCSADIRESIQAPRHWPLWGESTGNRWIPFTKGQ